MIGSICSQPNILEVMRIINIVIMIIKIVVPIILILFMMLEFMRAISSNDSEALQKAKKSAIGKMIAAALIFLMPTFVKLVVNIAAPNTDYIECLKIHSKDEINGMFNQTMDSLLTKAEESLLYSDYSTAMNYFVFIKDEDARQGFALRLSALKAMIEEAREQAKLDKNGKYSAVDYSKFKWTYYGVKQGPVVDYYKDTSAYAIWAPEKESDLNGASLPLIIWMHGLGSMVGECDGNTFLAKGLIPVIKNWSKYNLENVPAIIVAPQAYEAWGTTRSMETIRGLVKYTKEKYNIDDTKIILMGHSNGGYCAPAMMYQLRDLNFYAGVIMSAPALKVHNKEYMVTLKLRGYGEIKEGENYFKELGKEDAFTFYNGVTHSGVIEKAYTEDTNNDGVSDLMYWLFGNNAHTKPKQEDPVDPVDPDKPEDDDPGIPPDPKPITAKVNISSVNQAIANAVNSKGLYTREAVVAVAKTVVNELNGYNYRIPYQLGGMYHRGKTWGLNPNWGTVITHNKKYVLSGLDCRNFVNWCFKQAGLSTIRGFGYEGTTEKKWGDIYSNFGDGRPGDVIDASEHIMLIVDNDKSAKTYTVAESFGGIGVRIKTYTYQELLSYTVNGKRIDYKAYNYDGMYSNKGIWCTSDSVYRPYPGSCHIPKSEFPSYYGY